MNKFLFLLVNVIFSNLTITNAIDFDTSPLGMNFNGVIISGQNIIAYSDVGSYLITTDKGLHWEQKELVKSGSIKLMLDISDTLWALVDNGVICHSTDNGISWINRNFEMEPDDQCHYLALSESNIYVRCNKKIMQYDKNVKLMNTYSDTALFCDKLDFDRLEKFKYMGFIDGRLIVSKSNEPYDKNGQILILSENLEKIDSKDVAKVMPGISAEADFRAYELRNIQQYDSKNVYFMTHLPFYADNDYTEWTYIYNNSNTGRPFNNPPNTRNLANTYYISKENKIYYGMSCLNPQMDGLPSSYMLSTSFLHTVNIAQYDKTLDTFKIKGSIFNNNYYTLITPPWLYTDGMSRMLWYGSFVVMEDSIVVWVGGNKCLVQSRNGCKDWEVVSYAYQPKPVLILNDSNFYCYRLDKYEIYSTANGGECLVPVKIDTAEYYPFFPTFGDPMLFYMDSLGRGFITAAKYMNVYMEYKGVNYYTIGVTSDSGKSYKFLSKPSLNTKYLTSSYSNIINNDNEVLFSINKPDSSKIFTFNLENYEDKSIITDYQYSTSYILGDNFEDLILFQQEYPFNDDDDKLHVFQSSDSGKTKNEICSIDYNVNIVQTHEHNKDSVFFTSINPNRIYLYDRNRNAFDTLFADDNTEYGFLSLMVISDKFYIVGDSLFLENDDRMDLSSWAEGEWDCGRPKFRSAISKGNIALVEMSDSLRPWNYYKLSGGGTSTGVIEEIEEGPVHFFAAPAYPTPAKGIVRVKIYWDDNFDPYMANKYICDVTGSKIALANEILVENGDKFSCTLNWDCSKINSGVYFIIIDHNGRQRTIPVLVAR